MTKIEKWDVIEHKEYGYGLVSDIPSQHIIVIFMKKVGIRKLPYKKSLVFPHTSYKIANKKTTDIVRKKIMEHYVR